jgi:sirohydrochlorin ferrochelatase
VTGAPPVLIGCSHGTDSVAGRVAIRSILSAVRVARPDLDVREAFVDVQDPKVFDVVGDAVAGGGAAVVVPLLLSLGFHVRTDIMSAVLDRAAAAADVLGPDPRLVEILVDRLIAAGAGPNDAVVLAAAGSKDPRAAEAVEAVAAGLRAVWRGGPITVGYGAGTTPRVPDAVAAARAAGAPRVVVGSYLLAPGYFHDRVLEAGADVVSAPLAPDDRLTPIVLDRYAAATDRAVVAPED